MSKGGPGGAGHGVDVRCATPDEKAQLSFQAVDEYLKREFDLEGFLQFQETPLLGEEPQEALQVHEFAKALAH